MFSGGMDSTATAARYLQNGYSVLLVTFDNGAQRGLDEPRAKAELIAKKYKGRCEWKLLECVFLFHEIAIENLEEDIKKFGNLVCCGCKLAMLSEAIIYCKKHEIKTIADGFEKGQIYYPEQTPEYIAVADDFAGQFGINYLHPIYEMNAGQIENLVRNAGLPLEPKQSTCLFGLNRVSNKNIEEYTRSKLNIARHHIENALIKGG